GEEGAGEDPDPALGGAETEEMLLPLELGEGGRLIQVQAPPPGSAAAPASDRRGGRGHGRGIRNSPWTPSWSVWSGGPLYGGTSCRREIEQRFRKGWSRGPGSRTFKQLGGPWMLEQTAAQGPAA